MADRSCVAAHLGDARFFLLRKSLLFPHVLQCPPMSSNVLQCPLMSSNVPQCPPMSPDVRTSPLRENRRCPEGKAVRTYGRTGQGLSGGDGLGDGGDGDGGEGLGGGDGLGDGGDGDGGEGLGGGGGLGDGGSCTEVAPPALGPNLKMVCSKPLLLFTR